MGEANAFLCQGVEVRSPGPGIGIAADLQTEVVGNEDKDIAGRLRGGMDSGVSEQQHEQGRQQGQRTHEMNPPGGYTGKQAACGLAVLRTNVSILSVEYRMKETIRHEEDQPCSDSRVSAIFPSRRRSCGRN
jgi:hypothetical protein